MFYKIKTKVKKLNKVVKIRYKLKNKKIKKPIRQIKKAIRFKFKGKFRIIKKNNKMYS